MGMVNAMTEVGQKEAGGVDWSDTFRALFGVDLEKDLLANLGDRIVYGETFEGEVGLFDPYVDLIYKERIPSNPFLRASSEGNAFFALAVKDGKPWEKLLSNVALTSGGSVKIQDYLGVKLYVWETGNDGAAAFGVTDNWLLLGVRKEVEKIIRQLRSLGEGVEKDKEVRAGFSELPPADAVKSYAQWPKFLSKEKAEKLKKWLQKRLEAKEYKGCGKAIINFAVDALGSEVWTKKRIISQSVTKWEDTGLYMVNIVRLVD